MSVYDIGRRTVLRTAGAGLLATLGAGSAVGAETETAAGSDGGGGTTVPVRGAHLVPDAGAVDVYVDGQSMLSGVEYGSVTDYLPVPTGDHTVTLASAGNPDDVVAEETVSLSGDSGRRTVAAVGQRADDSAEAHAFTDATSNHDTATAQVRVVHASPDAPSVSVSAGGSTLFESVGFGEASDYAEVSAGDYSVSVAPADGGDAAASFDATFDGCSVYTVFTTGYLDSANAPEGTDAPFGVTTTLDDSGLEADYATSLSSDQSLQTDDSDAQGRAVFDRRGDEMRFEAAATGLDDSTVGHVHVGGPDESGPHVVTLYEFAPEDASAEAAPTVEGTLGNGSFTADDLVGPLEGQSLDALVRKMESGEAYVNFHTVAHPSGEIRGNF